MKRLLIITLLGASLALGLSSCSTPTTAVRSSNAAYSNQVTRDVATTTERQSDN